MHLCLTSFWFLCQIEWCMLYLYEFLRTILRHIQQQLLFAIKTWMSAASAQPERDFKVNGGRNETVVQWIQICRGCNKIIVEVGSGCAAGFPSRLPSYPAGKLSRNSACLHIVVPMIFMPYVPAFLMPYVPAFLMLTFIISFIILLTDCEHYWRPKILYVRQ